MDLARGPSDSYQRFAVRLHSLWNEDLHTRHVEGGDRHQIDNKIFSPGLEMPLEACVVGSIEPAGLGGRSPGRDGAWLQLTRTRLHTASCTTARRRSVWRSARMPSSREAATSLIRSRTRCSRAVTTMPVRRSSRAGSATRLGSVDTTATSRGIWH